MPVAVVSPEVIARLAAYYRRNGYTRLQNPDRVSAEGHQIYKKGDELRLVACSRDELRELQQLLKAAGFTPGKPFSTARQWRLPVYGRTEVARFLGLLAGAPAAAAATRPPRTRSRRARSR